MIYNENIPQRIEIKARKVRRDTDCVGGGGETENVLYLYYMFRIEVPEDGGFMFLRNV
jgi:hypothetical protein